MKQRKAYIIGGGENYICWMQSQRTYNVNDADFFVLTGGEDISPWLYGKNAHPTTSNNPLRDNYELDYFHKARDLNKPIIGICRGSQFLCAMAGGILVQNQPNPSFYHKIKLFDKKEELEISSTHHQAAYPFGMPKENYKIIGWTEGLLDYHQGEDFTDELNPPQECEIVYYPKIKSLGIQGHPEMIYHSEWARPTINYCRGLLDRFLDNKL